jgi:hypothetical protein
MWVCSSVGFQHSHNQSGLSSPFNRQRTKYTDLEGQPEVWELDRVDTLAEFQSWARAHSKSTEK